MARRRQVLAVPPVRAACSRPGGGRLHAVPRFPGAQRVRGPALRAAGAHLRAPARAARRPAHRARATWPTSCARPATARARAKVEESGWFARNGDRARHRAAAVRLLGRRAARAPHPRDASRAARSPACATCWGQEVPLARLEPLAIGGIYPGEQRGPRAGALGRGAEAPGPGADRHRGPQLPHAPRLRPARHRARRAERVPRRPGAGRQHADAAAGEELLPHARAHAPAQGHRAGDGGAARAALLARRRSSRPT